MAEVKYDRSDELIFRSSGIPSCCVVKVATAEKEGPRCRLSDLKNIQHVGENETIIYIYIQQHTSGHLILITAIKNGFSKEA